MHSSHPSWPGKATVKLFSDFLQSRRILLLGMYIQCLRITVFLIKIKKTIIQGAGEMAQQLEALVAPAKEWNLFPSMFLAHNYLPLQFQRH